MEASVELEIKQTLSQLSNSDLRSISAYLLRLRQTTEESKEERTMIMDEMDQGRKVRLSNLQLYCCAS
jgi:cytochrome c553